MHHGPRRARGDERETTMAQELAKVTRESVTDMQLEAFRTTPEAAYEVMKTINALIFKLKEDFGATHEQACQLVYAEVVGWQINARGL